MKNKKGFTLIELLAVIVILAIIALIATPIVLNMINSARKSSAKSSTLGFIDAVEYYVGFAEADSDDLNLGYSKKNIPYGGTCTFENGAFTSDSDPKCENFIKDVKPKMKGKMPDSYSFSIENGKVASGSTFKFGNMNCTYDGKDVEVVKGNALSSPTNPTNPTDPLNPITPDPGTSVPTEPEPEKGPTKVLATSADTFKAIVYLDPKDLTKKCDSTNFVGTTGTKSGCMRWFAFKDNGSSYTMILDHNTTAAVAWNSGGNNAGGMKEVKTALETDTTGWTGSPRLITADEVAEITKHPTFNGATSKDDKWFYFDTNTSTSNSSINSVGASAYWWLFDNTKGCTSSGCKIAYVNAYGYWTSTPVFDYSSNAWSVDRLGDLSGHTIVYPYDYGVRPVITIDKNDIS